jgi:chemotaxis protein MotB
MNESKQPFTDHVTRSKSSSKAGRLAWVAAIIMGASALSLYALWNSDRTHAREELQALQNNLGQSRTDLTNAQSQIQNDQSELAALKTQIADLEKQKQQVTQSSRTLEDEMRSQLESKDVTISKLQGKLTVNILDNVMFDSGEAILKPDGGAVMKKIAALLSEHPQITIQVVGHTDNVPIRPTGHTRFASNWELSTARALAAVHFLTEQSGIDPRRVGAAGYGEFRPAADNSTAEGRAKNRRIAITILPDELAPNDSSSATNAAVVRN